MSADDPELALDYLRYMLDFVRDARLLSKTIPWKLVVRSRSKPLLEYCFKALTSDERELVAQWLIVTTPDEN